MAKAMELSRGIQTLYGIIGNDIAKYFPADFMSNNYRLAVRLTTEKILELNTKDKDTNTSKVGALIRLHKNLLKIVILMSGDSDIDDHDWTPEHQRDILHSFLDTVKQVHNAGIKIFVLEILPRKTPTTISRLQYEYKRVALNYQLEITLPRITAHNTLIRLTNHSMVQEDGVTPTDYDYFIIADRIMSHINTTLNTPPITPNPLTKNIQYLLTGKIEEHDTNRANHAQQVRVQNRETTENNKMEQITTTTTHQWQFPQKHKQQ